MKKISFIIPAYNAENYIKNAVDSILNQNCENVEAIVINDGSTDKTLEILENYGEKIVLINQENQGVSKSRNVGLDKANGEWIVFLDADDWIDNNFLNQIDKYLVEDYDIIFTNIIIDNKVSNNDNNFEAIENKEELFNSIISMNYYNNSFNKKFVNNRITGGKIIKTSLIKENDIKFNEKLISFEDGMFYLNCILNTNKIAFWNYQYYFYREVENSATHKFNPNTINNLECLSKEMMNYIEANKLENLQSIPYFCFDLYREFIKYIVEKYKISNLSRGLKEMKKVTYEKNIDAFVNKIEKDNLNKKEKIIFSLLKKRCFLLLYILYLFR